MMLTLTQAAKATGKSKSTLLRAVKSGRLSASKDGDGSFLIDAAELSRVFPVTVDAAHDAAVTRHEPSVARHDASHDAVLLRGEVAMLREQLDREREFNRQLSGLLDDEREERRRLTRLLTHQSEKSLDTSHEPRPLQSRQTKIGLAVALGVAAALAWHSITKEQPPPTEAPNVQTPKQNNLERWTPDDNGG